MTKPDRPSGRHCDYCHAGGRTAPLILRDASAGCRDKIDTRHLYFHVPKLFTLDGLRTQARGVRSFLRAAVLSMRGATLHAPAHGRLSSLHRAFTVWIDQ